MQFNSHHTFKTILIIAAIVNLIALFLFEYGLPAPSSYASETAAVSEPAIAQEDASVTIPETADELSAALASTASTELAAASMTEAPAEELSDEVPAPEASSEETTETTDTPAEEEGEEEETDPEAPVLALTDDAITLEVGDAFNYMEYIETMEDTDGSMLDRYISLEGNVDTYTPGEYLVIYSIRSPVTGKSASRTLIVTVE